MEVEEDGVEADADGKLEVDPTDKTIERFERELTVPERNRAYGRCSRSILMPRKGKSFLPLRLRTGGECEPPTSCTDHTYLLDAALFFGRRRGYTLQSHRGLLVTRADRRAPGGVDQTL
jgi:hypothetical protein